MVALYVSLALLGLSAIDPIGLGIMPILLAQPKPYRRALTFLLGSWVSLMVMGLLFAWGLGRPVLRFEHSNTWVIPTVELAGGLVLLVVAVMSYSQLRRGEPSIDPSGRTLRWLQFGTWQLFGLGAFLVAVQSVIDVVFGIAMVRVGQFAMSAWMLAAAVCTYAVAALALQLLVIIGFWLAPSGLKGKSLARMHTLLARYSYQMLIVVSMLLAVVLFWLGLVR